jgi:carboxyl-terminal processing protease
MIDRGDEGIRALLDALTIEPNDPYAQSELRTSLSIQHASLDRWIKEIDGTSAADPALSSVRKGALLTSAGRFKEAEGPLNEAASRRPGDARVLVALALARRQAGSDGESAIADLRRARDLDPGYLYARLDLAMQLQARSALDESIAEAEAALRVSPDHPVALTILGASFRMRGSGDDPGKARLALRRAVQVEPMESSGAARFLLSKVEWELGLEDEARESLRGYIPVDPDEMYRVAWESVRDDYKDRTFNGQDWNVWRDRFAGALRTKADALGAIAQMLGSLDDRDTRLRSADQTSSMFFTPRSVNIERDSIGRTRAGSRTVASASLPGNVGYVAVTNMSDPKLVKEVRIAVDGMKDRDGLILDLRGNPGGAEEEVQAITSMLVPHGVPTGVVVSPAGKEIEKSQGTEPPVLPDTPVVVLVDRNTGSSAEALAGSLKESKRAIIVGEHTYGKAGIQLPRLLPDGTILLVAGGENATLSGKSYSAVGVKPDVSLESAMPAADPNGDQALQKAKEILTREQLRRKGATEGKPKP